MSNVAKYDVIMGAIGDKLSGNWSFLFMASSIQKRAWSQAVHTYDETWRPLSWLLPFLENKLYRLNPYRQAGPEHPDWGMPMFCCPLAVYSLLIRWPKQVPPQTTYLPVAAVTVARLLERDPQDWLHFILCDPHRLHHLRLISISPSAALPILQGNIPLSNYWHHTVEYT